MATITMQRDLVVALKKETVLNVGILSKLHAMPLDLTRQVFKENALEKPTQNLFNNLSHYLVCIIDPQASTSLSWPLYDSQTERRYRSELSNFITDYSSKGLLSPVMSSYLVNPGCYKVTMLIFQMSQLAVQKLLKTKMKKDSQKKLYNDMTEKYKSQETEGFIEQIEEETDIILRKFSNYLHKRKALETIAEALRKKISEMESKLLSTNAQMYLDDLVDEFVNKYALDDTTKEEILKVKDVNKPSQFFESWLLETDRKIDELESKWNEKLSPFIHICKETKFCTESLIARHTGEADKDSYMIEYNHKTNAICTNDLQSQVNSQQKYILKNIIKDERLNFPNLIRGFLIAISYILKNAEIGDEIYSFNENLEVGKRNYSEVVKALRDIVARVMNAEARLEPRVTYHHSVSIKDFPEIPPLPDLSDLRCTRVLHCQALFDSFTPLSVSKHQFNLQRRTTLHTFAKPQTKSLFVTPFHYRPKNDFMKSLISCRVSTYDHLNATQNFHNLSVISQSNKPNETIAECSSGFTKQQIMRLLSTKKSSTKKFKSKTERPNINIKKGGLFNASNSPDESSRLFRCHSSPNLFENTDKRPILDAGHRKLSIMQEHDQTITDMSGVTALDKDSSCDTPKGINLKSFRKITEPNIPVLLVTPSTDEKLHEVVKDFNVDLSTELLIEDVPKLTSKVIETKTETPKTNTQLIHKTSSLEKIINRFKKVRANVLSVDDNEQSSFQAIAEEKENVNFNVDTFSANRILLPDLLSPSCSVISKNSIDYLDQFCIDEDEKVCRKPRESLGTMLGVDHTFLDQFDLLD